MNEIFNFHKEQMDLINKSIQEMVNREKEHDCKNDGCDGCQACMDMLENDANERDFEAYRLGQLNIQ